MKKGTIIFAAAIVLLGLTVYNSIEHDKNTFVDVTSTNITAEAAEKDEVASEKKSEVTEEINYWEHFEEHNFLGFSSLKVSDICGDNFENLDSEYIYDTWQAYSDLGLMDPANTYTNNATGISYNFDMDMGDSCRSAGGTAEDMFGLTEAVDIDTFMSNMGVYMGDEEKYCAGITTDILSNSWVSFKDNVSTLNVYGMDYVYMVKVYSDGLKTAFPYDMSNFAEVNSNNITDYYGGIEENYNMVYPDTKVTVSLIEYGIGY